MKTITLHVTGTHCTSCKLLLEDILNEQIGIKNANVNLKQETVSFETNFDDNLDDIAKILTQVVQSRGYSFSTIKATKVRNDNMIIWQAIPIGLSILTVFFLLQKSGILNFSVGGTTTPTTSFLIGLIASVSSCLAIVGGLVLSLSATVSQDNIRDTKPMIQFHIGRLTSFAILGGILGILGQTIGINFTLSTILGIIASLVMIILGLNLVGFFNKSTITLPSNIFSFLRKVEHNTITPFLIGFGTFFLPCGFTQSMQFSALSSGSFISGLLIMLAFALGTLPMLILLSFGSASFAHGKHAMLFLKSAGIVVIGLGLFGFISGLAGIGIIKPLFNI